MLTNDQLCVLLRAFKQRLEREIVRVVQDPREVQALVAELDAAILSLESETRAGGARDTISGPPGPK